MTTLDWIMLGVYLIIAVVGVGRVRVCGVVGLNHTGNSKVEYVLVTIGLLVGLYLIVRHPWMCLVWFVAGSIATVVWHLLRANKETQKEEL